MDSGPDAQRQHSIATDSNAQIVNIRHKKNLQTKC